MSQRLWKLEPIYCVSFPVTVVGDDQLIVEGEKRHPAPSRNREKLQLYDSSAVEGVLYSLDDSDNDSEEDMVVIAGDLSSRNEQRYEKAKKDSRRQRDNPSRGFRGRGRGGGRGGRGNRDRSRNSGIFISSED